MIIQSISWCFITIAQHVSAESAGAPRSKRKTRLTVVVGVAKRPGLVGVKVRVSSDAGAGEVSVGQEAPLSVERGAVTVETRGEEDHDVSLFALVLDLRVRHLLSGIRGTNKESIFQKVKNTVSFTRSGFLLRNDGLTSTVQQQIL